MIMKKRKSQVVTQSEAKGLYASTGVCAGANLFGCRKVDGKMVKKPVEVCINGDCETKYQLCRYNGWYWS